MHLTSLPGGNSKLEPPDSISNSEVKLLSADGSVGSPHVRVGHRQALIRKPRIRKGAGFFYARGGARQRVGPVPPRADVLLQQPVSWRRADTGYDKAAGQSGLSSGCGVCSVDPAS